MLWWAETRPTFCVVEEGSAVDDNYGSLTPPPPRIMKGFVAKETMGAVSVGKWNLKIWVNDQVAVVERRR